MQKQKTIQSSGDPATDALDSQQSVAIPDVDDVLAEAEAAITAQTLQKCGLCGAEAESVCQPVKRRKQK
jgi:hypothetical protein